MKILEGKNDESRVNQMIKAWASQVALMVKNLSVQETREIQVQSLGREDILE